MEMVDQVILGSIRKIEQGQVKVAVQDLGKSLPKCEGYLP